MSRPLPSLIPVLVVILMATAARAVGTQDDPSPPEPPPVQQGPGHAGTPATTATRAGLQLVPMDGVPARLVRRVAGALGRGYDVRVEVLPRMRTPTSAIDPSRHQLIGEQVTHHVGGRHRVAHPGAAVIGITDTDLYFSGRPEWRFAFGTWDHGGYGAISTAHMDPVNFGRAPDERVLTKRLTAMTARYLGRLAFDQPTTSPRGDSAMRESLLALEELDQMTPWLCPPRPGHRRTC